jgi:hypothetical protein
VIGSLEWLIWIEFAELHYGTGPHRVAPRFTSLTWTRAIGW